MTAVHHTGHRRRRMGVAAVLAAVTVMSLPTLAATDGPAPRSSYGGTDEDEMLKAEIITTECLDNGGRTKPIDSGKVIGFTLSLHGGHQFSLRTKSWGAISTALANHQSVTDDQSATSYMGELQIGLAMDRADALSWVILRKYRSGRSTTYSY